MRAAVIKSPSKSNTTATLTNEIACARRSPSLMNRPRAVGKRPQMDRGQHLVGLQRGAADALEELVERQASRPPDWLTRSQPHPAPTVE